MIYNESEVAKLKDKPYANQLYENIIKGEKKQFNCYVMSYGVFSNARINKVIEIDHTGKIKVLDVLSDSFNLKLDF